MASDLDLGSDHERLSGFLDWFRGVVEGKFAGLSTEEATAFVLPSGSTMLGFLNHLGWVERLWFRERLLGEADAAGDPDKGFRLTALDTVESVLAGYRADCDRSREIAAGLPLDHVALGSHPVFGIVDLGWILIHMIEETARHAGHLDILRELTDGRTGD